MSAITGIFNRHDNSVDNNLIKKMNNKLSHRGPDGSKILCEKSSSSRPSNAIHYTRIPS